MSVYALNLLREMTRRGHDLTMISQYRGDEEGIAVYGGGPPPDVEDVTVIGLEALGEQDGGDFERDVEAMAQAAVRVHEKKPFDLVHAQYAYPTGLAALAASRRLGLPNVVSIQGGDGHWVGSCCKTHEDAMHAVLGHAGALLIGSDSFAEEVTERLGTPPERFTVVPGAVDLGRFHPREGRAPGDLHNPPVFLYHGRIDRRKGALDLLDAFALLVEKRPARLVVSGIGPDAEAAAEKARALGLQEHVEMSGYAEYEDVPALYRRADVFVSPTYAEGFSNTILEAMASALPIVSCRAVGVVDCLRHEENALLTEPGRPGALASALERMLVEEGLRRRLAREAYDEVRRRYAWEVVGGQIEGVYEALAGTAPDTAWTLPDGPPDACRFRAEPHLL